LDAVQRCERLVDRPESAANQDALRALHNAVLAVDRRFYPPPLIEARGERFRASDEAATFFIGPPCSWRSLHSTVLDLLETVERVRPLATRQASACAGGLVSHLRPSVEALTQEVRQYREWLHDTAAGANAIGPATPEIPRSTAAHAGPPDGAPVNKPVPSHVLLASVRHLFAVPPDADKPGPFVAFVRFQPGAAIDLDAPARDVHLLALSCLQPFTFRGAPVGQFERYAVLFEHQGREPLEWVYVTGLGRLRIYQQAAVAAASCLSQVEVRDGEAVTVANLRGQVDPIAKAPCLWTAYAYRRLRMAGMLQSGAILDGKASVWWFDGDAFTASLVAIELAGSKTSEAATARPAPPQARDADADSLQRPDQRFPPGISTMSPRAPRLKLPSVWCWAVSQVVPAGPDVVVASGQGDPFLRETLAALLELASALLAPARTLSDAITPLSARHALVMFRPALDSVAKYLTRSFGTCAGPFKDEVLAPSNWPMNVQTATMRLAEAVQAAQDWDATQPADRLGGTLPRNIVATLDRVTSDLKGAMEAVGQVPPAASDQSPRGSAEESHPVRPPGKVGASEATPRPAHMPRPFPVFSDTDTHLFYLDPLAVGVRWIRSWPNDSAGGLSELEQYNNTLNPAFLDAALLRLADGRWCRCSWEHVRGQRLFAGRLVSARRAADLLEGPGFTLPPEWQEILDADCRRETPADRSDVSAPDHTAMREERSPAERPGRSAVADDEAMADGPIPPDMFRWRGREVGGLSVPQWRLLGALCDAGRLRAAVPLAEVVCHVYGAKAVADDNRRRALEQLRRRTQTKLDAAGVPLLIDLTNQSYRLIPI
jgi:hypothetical protein